MPKNGNRGVNTKNANAPFASNNKDIDSKVIFGDAKTTRKAKQGSTVEDSAKKGDTVPASSEDPPKKPDPRKLVSNSQKASDCCQDDTRAMIRMRFSRKDISWLKSHLKK